MAGYQPPAGYNPFPKLKPLTPEEEKARAEQRVRKGPGTAGHSPRASHGETCERGLSRSARRSDSPQSQTMTVRLLTTATTVHAQPNKPGRTTATYEVIRKERVVCHVRFGRIAGTISIETLRSKEVIDAVARAAYALGLVSADGDESGGQ